MEGRVAKGTAPGYKLTEQTLKVVALVIYDSGTGAKREREVLMWAQFKSVISGDG